MYTHEYDSDYPYGPAMSIVELRVRQIAAYDGGIGLRPCVDRRYGRSGVFLDKWCGA